MMACVLAVVLAAIGETALVGLAQKWVEGFVLTCTDVYVTQAESDHVR